MLTGKKLGQRETQSAGVLRINGAARGNIQLFTGGKLWGILLPSSPGLGGSWLTGQGAQSWCAQPAARASPPGSGARFSWEESPAQWAPPVPRAFVHVSPFTTHSLGDVDMRAPFYRCHSEAQRLCSLPEVPSWPCVGTVYCTTFLLRLLRWPVPSSQGPAHFVIGQLHRSHLLASHSTPCQAHFPPSPFHQLPLCSRGSALPALPDPETGVHLCTRLPHGPRNQSWKGPYIT